MKYLNIAAFLALLFVVNALPRDADDAVSSEVFPSTNNDTLSVTDDAKEVEVKNMKQLLEEEEEEVEEIVISKDNLIPILRTVLFAFVQKKDHPYKALLQTGGKNLFKLAGKMIGNDKHMKGILEIIKKYVDDFNVDEMSDEEEEFVSDLAKQYLKKHKFKILFPESLLLHQPEIEEFIAKKNQLGNLEGRQLRFNFRPYIDRFQAFTSSMRSRISNSPLFRTMNFDRIGNTFSNLGLAIDGYIPALRDSTGIMNLGVSMGSLTALAAAGALISAPFFLRSFSASGKEEEEHAYDINRRITNFEFVPPQFMDHAATGELETIKHPEWMKTFESEKERTYSPNVNPHYTEPSFALHNAQTIRDPNAAQDDAAYNKYLHEYNQWLQQYHNALSLQQNPDKEYEEYYKKYREWYAQYYNEQFGGDLPQHQPVAPNAYDENNNIRNMEPPPVQKNNDKLQNSQLQKVYEKTNPARENERINFQVIHVDEQTKPTSKAQRQVEHQLPESSSLVSHTSSYNYKANNKNISPYTVYKPLDPVSPSTESGFRPLGSEDHTILFFKKKDSDDNKYEENYEFQATTNKPSTNNLSGFSSIKSMSIFDYPINHISKSQPSESGQEPFARPPVQNFKINTGKPKLRNVYTEKVLPRREPTLAPPKISSVTSGIFKTTSQSTDPSATTPPQLLFNRHKSADTQSVRVVTSTSVVTSSPFLKHATTTFNADSDTNSKAKIQSSQFKKRKITLTDLLHNQREMHELPSAVPVPTRVEQLKATEIEKRKDQNQIDIEDQLADLSFPLKSVEDDSNAKDDLPVYALDPFYGPRLSRTDAIFHQLSLMDENCREQVVCNMYKNPNAYTPLSDFLSRQLTVTYEQLKRPTVNDERVLRFFKYLQAARAGQDGFNCLERYPACPTDTTRLSYKPIVNAYKKVSVLMNASGAT